MLLKRPGFTALAALTLAIGIGATAAVFSLVEGVLLTPPPYHDPDRLVLVPSVRVDSQQVERIEATPAIHWLDWQKQATTFDSVAAHVWTFNFRIDNAGSESIEGMVVTPEYFRVIGVQPMLGRAFTPADATPGQPSSVIILGYEYWQRRFNGDPAIVGKTIRMTKGHRILLSIQRISVEELPRTSGRIRIPSEAQTAVRSNCCADNSRLCQRLSLPSHERMACSFRAFWSDVLRQSSPTSPAARRVVFK